jgi:glucose/arabinose dehydrogenase
MSQGRLAVGLVVLVLAAGCTNGPGEGVTEFVTTTGETTTATSTGAEDNAGGPLPAVDPGEPAQGGPLDLDLVASGLDSPTFVTSAPGQSDRLYVTEQPGRIRIVEGKHVLPEPFLDLASEVTSGGERGLLSVAFHPDFVSNGLFYVNYTDREGDTRVAEFRESAAAGAAKTREILYVSQPYANHNGGQLAFDLNGLLYVGMGDGGSAGDPLNVAQDPASRLGKLLRLDVDEPGAEWETVGIGLRNPWRFSFDRLTGDLWLADVGQRSIEEANFVPAEELGAGHNYGWDVYEGSREFERKALTDVGTLVEPITEYTHRFGCSVTGGFVYRGERIRREARGRYFYGDYCSGRIWSVARWRGEVTRRGHPFRVPQLTSFAEDLSGELYALSGEGTVYRFRQAM